MPYKHTQVGYFIIFSMLFVIALIAIISFFTMWVPASIAVVGFLFIALLLFYSLKVNIENELLELSFGVGIIRKKFKLADIKSVKIVKNHWYYGLGIRLLPDGWLYSVSGLNAVELGLIQGEKIHIGTDEPEKLRLAIENNIQSFKEHDS